MLNSPQPLVEIVCTLLGRPSNIYADSRVLFHVIPHLGMLCYSCDSTPGYALIFIRYVAGVKLKKQVEKRKTSENNKTSSTLAMLHKKRALLKERKERRKAARNASKNGTGVAGKTVRVATIKAIKAAKIVKAATRSKSSPATASSSTSSSSSSFGGLKKGFLL